MTAERLRKLRAERGLSQVDLSRRSGLTQAAISMYETGKMDLRGAALETIVALAQALKCTLFELTGLESLKGFETDKSFKPSPEALEFWEAYKNLPDGPEKDFIEAKLLKRDDGRKKA